MRQDKVLPGNPIPRYPPKQHIATFAETEDVAVVSGSVVLPEYRKTDVFVQLDSYMGLGSEIIVRTHQPGDIHGILLRCLGNLKFTFLAPAGWIYAEYDQDAVISPETTRGN
mgnify:CR=1 FL=1